MRWSKVKKEVEAKFSDKLRGRVQLYITSYGQGYDINDLFNRGWITVDGKEVVNFSTPDSFYLKGSDFNSTTPIGNVKAEEVAYEHRTLNQLSGKGEFSKFDLSYCCYAYLDMAINEALNHESPVINMLAVLDKRTGKRKLFKLNENSMHPLVRYFFRLRLEAEKIVHNVIQTKPLHPDVPDLDNGNA